MASKTACLVAFDAFGTLFSPRASIGKQYTVLTQKYLSSKYPSQRPLFLDPHELEAEYKKSFEAHRQAFPNYGKESGLDPKSWWQALIKQTLEPHLKDRISSSDWSPLTQCLWDQFSSNKGYTLRDDAHRLLKHLRRANRKRLNFIVGVVTNSDPRVKRVLETMAFKTVPPNTPMNDMELREHDFHFILTSYEAGVSKPDKKIFDIAEQTARNLLPQDRHDAPMPKVFIGDEHGKDGISAIRAGWHSVIVDRNGTEKKHFRNGDIEEHANGLYLERVSSLWPFNPTALSDTFNIKLY